MFIVCEWDPAQHLRPLQCLVLLHPPWGLIYMPPSTCTAPATAQGLHVPAQSRG